MADGVRRDSRAMVVAQAALVWAISDVDLEKYLDTGNLTKVDEIIVPFDPTLRSAIVQEFQPHLSRTT